MRPVDRRVLPHLAPARLPLTGLVAAALAGGLLTVAQAFAAGLLVVRLVTDPGGGSWHAPAVWLLVVVAARALAAYASDVAAAAAADAVSHRLRHRLLATLGHGDRPRRDDLVLLATRGMSALEPYVTRFLPALVTAAVLPAAALVAIWWLDPLSGLIVLLTLPLVPVFAALVGQATAARAERQWRRLGDLSGHFLDVVRGLPTLVAHRRAEAQSRTIRQVTDEYRRATLATLRLAFASSAVLELVATVSVALVAVTVGLRLAAGSLPFTTALVVLLLAPEAYWPLRRVGAEFHAAAEGAAALGSALEVLGEDDGRPAGGRAAPPAGPVSLRLRGVGLGHDHRRGAVVLGLDARLDGPGLHAVAGPSGCGKSTLLAALAGELACWTGRIEDGGVPLADLDPEAWRDRVAFTDQRPWLAATPISEVLRVGRPDAPDADLWRALAEVGLAEVVAALPAGLATALGEDGAGLSAGQRARLGLARVVVAGRPLVLLDEPTAHLDPASRATVVGVLRRLARVACVVVATHDPDLQAEADQVVRLPASVDATRSRATGSLSVPRADATPAGPVHDRIDDGTGQSTDRATEAATSGGTAQGRPRHGTATATALGALASASGVALTATAAWLVTRAAEHPPVLTLLVAIVGVRLFGLARPVLRWTERLVTHDVALRELAARRAAVYDAVVPLVPAHLGVRRGALLDSIVEDVDAGLDEEVRVALPRRTALVVVLGAAGLVALLDPAASAVVLGIGASGLVAGLVVGWWVRSDVTGVLASRTRLATSVEAVVDSARPLRRWNRLAHALDAVDDDAARLARAARRGVRALAGGRALVSLAGGAGAVAMAALVSSEAPSALSPAAQALLVMLPLALLEVVATLPDAGATAARCREARARLERLAALAPAVSEPEDPLPVVACRPEVALESVTAGWPGRRPAVRDLDLDLPPRARLGLVGPSGSGKSTVAALLMRFLDPVAGTVRCDGDDVRTLTSYDLRGAVRLVDDDPYVFSSTLAENVRLARPDATDADVAAALERAHLGAWLASLPDGLHTRLGRGGSDVSGGERARLGIARALLADAPVLVLDEPTTHLDPDTARRIAHEVLGGRRERSVLWISHDAVGRELLDATLDLCRHGEDRAVVAGARGGARAGA